MTGAGALAGAWRRSALTVDGVAGADICDVLWLQTDRWFADMRVPVAAAPSGPTVDRWRIEIVDGRPDGPLRAVRYERDAGGNWHPCGPLDRPALA